MSYGLCFVVMTRMITMEEAHMYVPTKVMQISLKDSEKANGKSQAKRPRPREAFSQFSEVSGLLTHEKDVVLE